ncbi:MAG: type II toxin-antitoxin system RelE/ParE family toxin [Bacteroidia bacterium]|nr:type II toxin-antitoxin system RelE/ParE family toxin [Bacteroidia bacterium]
MYSVILLEEARNEWLDSAFYYEVQQKGLGERFSTIVKITLDKISENPKIFQKKKNDYRQAVLKPFPFVVLFIRDKHSDTIVVTGIFHTKRQPNKKFNRE